MQFQYLLIKILERECLEKGVEIRRRTLVNRLVRIRGPAGDSPVVYEVGYIRTRGRVLPGSDSEAANDFDTNSQHTVIKIRSAVLTIPLVAISRVVYQETSLSASSLLRSLTHHPLFSVVKAFPPSVQWHSMIAYGGTKISAHYLPWENLRCYFRLALV